MVVKMNNVPFEEALNMTGKFCLKFFRLKPVPLKALQYSVRLFFYLSICTYVRKGFFYLTLFVSFW